MNDFDIIEDYKEPSDKEIEETKNFSGLMAKYKASKDKRNRPDFNSGRVFLGAFMGLITGFTITYFSFKNGDTQSKIQPVEKAPVPSIKKEEDFTIVEEKESSEVRLNKSDLKRSPEIKNKTSSNNVSKSKEHLSTDSLMESVTDKRQVPIQIDSVVEPVKQKVTIKNGNQTIYQQDKEELERKMLERYKRTK